jgi:hypothetical protein
MTDYTLPALTADKIVEVKPASAPDEPSLTNVLVEARSANAFLAGAVASPCARSGAARFNERNFSAASRRFRSHFPRLFPERAQMPTK